MVSNPYVSLLRTAWIYARSERKTFVFVYAFFACSNLVVAAHPMLYGWFIDRAQKDPHNVLKLALVYGGIYLALKLAEWGFHGPARIMERKLAFNLGRNFLKERYHQALHLPVKWHQDHHSGATINRIRKAHDALRGFFDGGFMYIHALSKLIFSLIAVMFFSPLFGTIGALLGVGTVWIILRFDKPLIETQKEVNEAEHLISANLFDSLSNIMTVITLRLEQSMQAGLLAKVQRVLKPFRKNAVINEWKWFVADTLVTLIYIIVVLGYIYQHWSPGKVFYIGGLITLVGYVNQFTSVFHDVAWQYTQIVQYNTDVETSSAIEEAFKAHHRADSLSDLPDGWRLISLRGLNFSYRESYDSSHAPQSLHGLHLKLERGKRVALVGESGSGKSTLLSLLRGLYDPEPDLEFLVDGRPFGLSSLNESVTLFPQDPEIFENTIEYNITLDLPTAPRDIEWACETAHFSNVIQQLPRGLDSSIQEKGVNLSGGQKQRLALARGVLAARASSVVLLDEPTSSVDPKTEAQIYEKLFVAFSDKVMVSALHRLHLLQHFDYVYVLDRGSIVAEGSLEHLRVHSVAFQELWRHQEEKEGTLLLQAV